MKEFNYQKEIADSRMRISKIYDKWNAVGRIEFERDYKKALQESYYKIK